MKLPKKWEHLILLSMELSNLELKKNITVSNILSFNVIHSLSGTDSQNLIHTVFLLLRVKNVSQSLITYLCLTSNLKHEC